MVIGVHTPEFAYERDTTQRQKCGCAAPDRLPGGAGQRVRHVERLSQPLLARRAPISWMPGAVIRHIQIGEGGYEKAEQVIQQLSG